MTRSACLFRRGFCRVKVWGLQSKPISGFILERSGTRLPTEGPSSQSASVAVLPDPSLKLSRYGIIAPSALSSWYEGG